MRAYVGGGWHIHHLTDRTIHLKKPHPTYWSLTGDDGFVLVRVGPESSRDELITEALKKANETDQRMTERIAAELTPRTRDVTRYRHDVQRLAPIFGTPEDEAAIGRKRV